MCNQQPSANLSATVSYSRPTIHKIPPDRSDAKVKCWPDYCLFTGIPDLGVPSIDPLHISALTIHQGRNSPISLKQEFKNILLTGISETKLVTYKPNLDKYILRTEGITPRVNLAGEYTMTGRILLLPIVGHGRANITMVDLKTVHELIGEPIKKNGEIFIRFKEYNIKLIPGRVYLYFENLFNGDKLLGNQMNRFMNDNWELIFNELKGGYEETLSYVFKEVTNKLFTKVPMDRIFPRTPVKESEEEKKDKVSTEDKKRGVE